MTNLTAMTLENRIVDLLSNENRFNEVFHNDLGNKVEIQVFVDWGDWKHDHLYTDYLMREADFLLIDEQVTYEDGDDCYGSIHKYEYSPELAELHKIIKGEE